MHDVGGRARPLLPLACAALLAMGGCFPLVYHDGLPAWTPPPGKVEGSIGYQRTFWPENDSTLWYLTPGARIGLGRRPPYHFDIGLTGLITYGQRG